ncbi:hypothetical protein ACXZ66_01665 [Corynebacterium sp. S7]
MKTYVVPDHGLGAIRKLRVEEVDTELISGLFQEQSTVPAVSALDLAVIIIPDEQSGELYLLFESTVIGVISTYDRRAYPELDWIGQAGLVPQVTARATLTAGEKEVELEVRLPRPGLCVPENNPPTSPWVLLDGDAVYNVELFETEEQGPAARGRRHALLSLHTAEDSVEVRLDGTLVGHVVEQAPLSETVAALEHKGLVPVVRGFFAPVAGEPTLTFRAGEVPADEDLAISPIPALPKQEPKRALAQEAQTSTMPVVVADADTDKVPEKPDIVEKPEEPRTGYLPSYQAYQGSASSEAELEEVQENEKSRREKGAAIVAVVVVVLIVLAALWAAGVLPFGAS